MKTIPEIRKELLELATHLNSPRLKSKLKSLVKQMYRRPTVRRAATESTPMTPALRSRIRAFAAANPRMSYIKMAPRFRVSTGRISEALAGKRAA